MRYCVNMNSVTEDIRAELRAILARRRIKQTDLARELGTSRTYVSNMLNGQRGQLSPVWVKLLEHLDLELVLQPRDHSGDDRPTPR